MLDAPFTRKGYVNQIEDALPPGIASRFSIHRALLHALSRVIAPLNNDRDPSRNRIRLGGPDIVKDGTSDERDVLHLSSGGRAVLIAYSP